MMRFPLINAISEAILDTSSKLSIEVDGSVARHVCAQTVRGIEYATAQTLCIYDVAVFYIFTYHI